MFIIWGTKPTTKLLGTTHRLYTCEHCNNTNHFNINSYKTWFTIYFIPLFPVHIQYRIECPICEYGYTVKRKLIKEIFKTSDVVI